MHPKPASEAPAAPPGPIAGDARRVPGWLVSTGLSTILHLSAILLLGLLLGLAPARGTSVERTAEVGIVLKHQDGPREYFEGPPDGQPAAEAAAASEGVRESLADSLRGAAPSDPTTALPSAAVLGPGALEGGGVATARGADRAAGRGGLAVGGKGRTSVFGVEGEGYKFVYVFDRSGSMGGSGRSALSAAKAELLESLKSLEKTHQFQIIFYNDRLMKFNPTGDPNRLVFANETNKAAAARFLNRVRADGGTEHQLALSAAMKLQPDVIFFLTDADEPKLYPHQLAKIHRLAGGITIHAIEFGYGPQYDDDNFLVRLARQNGGKHGYVDISKLAAGGDR